MMVPLKPRMARFLIHGGNTLSGSVTVGGSKNHITKILPASLLFSKRVQVDNVPQVEDVLRGIELLQDVGCEVAMAGTRRIVITPCRVARTALRSGIAERIRTSILFAGPLLAREGTVSFPHPGGCVIGKRPIDLFLDSWQAMGVKVRETRAGYRLSTQKLIGIDYTFRSISHTATESLMLTAVLAHGRTVIRNAALEPEVAALAEFLVSGGAKIIGAGTPTITIDGTNGRLLREGSCTIMPDRVEAACFAILGALAGKNMRIGKCMPEHLQVLIAHLRSAGVRVETGSTWIRVSKPRTLKPVNVRTHEYPGFATDYQAPFVVLLTQAAGQAQVFETLFEGRLLYIEDLNRMGANIIPCDPHRIIVTGSTPLHGRTMESPDLRAGLAFVIAALIAKGESSIGNIYQIDRGYEAIDERLRALGADIQRVE